MSRGNSSPSPGRCRGLHIEITLPSKRVERREQRGRAMTPVVVGDGADAPALDRQARLCAVERLDLALLCPAQLSTGARSGGFTYRPTTSISLSAKRGSRENLKVRLRSSGVVKAVALPTRQMAEGPQAQLCSAVRPSA